jgi:hypothetical protein
MSGCRTGMQRTSGARRTVAGMLAMLALCLTGCEWLLQLDRVPPFCRILSPADSATVSGHVQVRADASDSIGVSRIEFYADGGWFGSESLAVGTAVWDADSLPDGSWHQLSCVAFDLAGNAGYSETVAVRVARPEQRSIYHGTVELNNGYYFHAGFTAEPGETLAGDARVASNGDISLFLWLDRVNFSLFRQSQQFSSLYEATGATELSVRRPVPVSDSFYLVMVNTTGYPQSYWVRFGVE